MFPKFKASVILVEVRKPSRTIADGARQTSSSSTMTSSGPGRQARKDRPERFASCVRRACKEEEARASGEHHRDGPIGERGARAAATPRSAATHGLR